MDCNISSAMFSHPFLSNAAMRFCFSSSLIKSSTSSRLDCFSMMVCLTASHLTSIRDHRIEPCRNKYGRLKFGSYRLSFIVLAQNNPCMRYAATRGDICVNFMPFARLPKDSTGKGGLQTHQGLIFVASTGRHKKIKAVIRLKHLCKRLGISPHTTHDLKHTFSTRCFEAGLEPKTIQVLLGDTSLSMMMHTYIHISQKMQAQKMKQLNAYYRKLKEQENKKLVPIQKI